MSPTPLDDLGRRKGNAEGHIQTFRFANVSPGTRLNSLILSATRISECASVWPARRTPYGAIGCPFCVEQAAPRPGRVNPRVAS